MITSNQIKNTLVLSKEGLYRPQIQVCIPGLVTGATKNFLHSLDNLRKANSQENLLVHIVTWSNDSLNKYTLNKILESSLNYPNVILNIEHIDANDEFKDLVYELLSTLKIEFNKDSNIIYPAALKKIVYLYTTSCVMQAAYNSYAKWSRGPEFPTDVVFLKMSTKTIIEPDLKKLTKNLETILNSILNIASRHFSIADYSYMDHSFDMISSYLATTSGIGDISYFISPEKSNKVFGNNINDFKHRLVKLYKFYRKQANIDLNYTSNLNYLSYTANKSPFEGSVILKDFINISKQHVPYLSCREFLNIFKEIRSTTSPYLWYENGRFNVENRPELLHWLLQYDKYEEEYLVDFEEIKAIYEEGKKLI